MNKLELLAPAGNKERLQTAFYFGADACYLGGKQYGLRAFSDNFDNDELKQYIDYAHSLGKKVYVTVNIFAHNADFVGMADYLKYLEFIKADAIIVSDPGIISLAKSTCPNLEIHLSTQANCTNKYSAKFWEEQGVKRLILARELKLDDIKEIRDYISDSTVLETFVHGAMCISYSGRCLLSNYLANRDSNHGACVQACRWEYALTEKKRQGEQYDIQEDERGTYILNSKDLCMIEYLDKLADAGVTSFKIEGRMKTAYYVANIVNAYRRALNLLGNSEYKLPQEIKDEVYKSSHRNYATGFYFGNEQNIDISSSTPVSTYDFIAEVVEDSQNNLAKVEQRNRFKIGDELEILSPNENFNKTFVVEKIINSQNEEIDDAKNVQEILSIYCPYQLSKGDILRKKSIEQN